MTLTDHNLKCQKVINSTHNEYQKVINSTHNEFTKFKVTLDFTCNH